MNTINNNSGIEMFSSKFGKKNINILFSKKTLWLSKEDICLLLNINDETLTSELTKIFCDGIFSKAENRERFILGNDNNAVEFFRLGVIISLGYRLKAIEGTQHIIKTNRLIKSQLSSSSKSRYSFQGSVLPEKISGKSLISKALSFIYSYSTRKVEMNKRVYS